MKKHDIGSVPVISDLVSKKLEGIVTDRDLCVRLVAENRNPETTQVGALMTRNPTTCGPNDLLQQCEQLMVENRIRRIPVVICHRVYPFDFRVLASWVLLLARFCGPHRAP